MFLVTAATHAQIFMLDLPQKSQAAEVSQRIGLTDVEIRYHRPLVNGRKIWGDLVPYGEVWRTGANNITTFRVTDPVTIEGQPLAAGTYGLHAIPGPEQWTLIFSNNATSWGSFTYDKSEDALRVTVKPRVSEMHEAMTFEFDEVEPEATTVALKWEKLAVPFHIRVPVHDVVQASIKRQLRTLNRYNWLTWNEAANYLLSEKLSAEDALAYANKSITYEDRFDNELTKAKALTALHRDAEAAAAQRRALEVASPKQREDFAKKKAD
jgi:hypothetical protein